MAYYMEHFGLASECRCLINRRYKTFVSTLHCVLEYGADLYVNERQKIRNYRARSTEENSKVHERLSLELITECFHKLE